ncbi:MAG: amino acid adenylation domain-containing protein, partial [bacterium]|nr:amino acid adenylation domain-containing protein [bacterium]
VDQCLVLASDGTQWDEKIKECKQCGITNVYSHVTIQPNGDCNFCTDFERYKEDLQRYFKTREELAELIREKNAEKTSQYDCLIVYNGGRGAAYALYRLKEMGFNVLAITFDNGYFSPKDLINIKRLTTSLGVDHDVLTHPRVDPIFKKSLEKAHTVCRGCYHISGSLAVEYANKHNINVTVGASLSKGQIIENNLLPYLGMGITDPAELEKNVDQIAQKSREVDKSIFDLIGISEISDGNAFKNVTSVNFYRYCEITNIELIAYLEEDGPYARLELPAVGKIPAMTQGEYWKTRYKHAIYSTNCAIKQLGDYGVLREEGHHYYGAATAWERRLGHITRENFENDLSNIITEPQHDRFLQHFGVEAGPGTLQGNKELFVAAYIITRSGTLDLLKLREEMAKKLPAYMIPSYFVLIDKIPLTLNGKIDQQALPDPRKSIIRETFVPPSEGIQQTLAETWADILGVDKIGIDDNFFQAGGDSIKAIQVSARLVPQRLKLEIRDLFDNPTIRQLENYVKTVANLDLPEAEQGTIKGDVAISPIQHWYFENFPETLRHHVNQAVMLYKKDGFDKENLKTLLDEIIEHHDALRMIFVNDQNTPLGIRQVDRDLEESPLNLEVRDFTRGNPEVADRVKPGVAGRDKLVVSEPGKPAEPPEIVGIVGTVTPELDRETIKKIETETERIQGSINLAKGPLVKIVLFKTDHGDHLLIVIHHLVIDGVSWLILLEDLVTGYSQLGISGTVQLPEKTNSFQRWTEKLTEYAQSRELLDQLPYWKDVEETEVRSLPNDIEEIAKITGTSQETGTPQGSTNIRKRIYQETVTLNLNEKETHLLLTEANRPYNTEINDILVTVLADAFRDWGGMERITISMEGHGRESVIPGMTIARTVGWFTSIYPVILDVNQAREISRAIKDVKEHLRQIPNKGIGYGILRYLTPAELKKDVNFRMEPEINFNYLGQYRETGEGTIRLSNLSTGTSLNPELEHLFAIDINGMISGGCLTLSFAYSHREFKKDNIEKLVQIYKNTLLQVITHCAEKKTTELTPSDLDLPGITIHELEALEASFAKENKYIRDIYPLSPMQEGMLFHSRIDETAGTPVYFEQLTLTIAGDPDLNVMARTFNRLIEKYEVLRTVFVYETTHRPAQVLLKKKAAVMHVEDISHLSTGGVGAYLEQFKREDREMGFDLTVGPLMRVAMFITGQQRYTIVWSFHHILMDGWCFSILFGDFVNIYRTLKRGELPLQEQAIPYKRFIKWLQKQDKEEGLSYWTNYLDGYQQPAGVPKQALPQQTTALDKALKQEQARVKIDGALLGDYTRREDGIQVTLNTLFQTYWGIMLQRYNNTDDVVFGIVVSGRPPEIEGIEDMVGLFINTVPVRVKCKNQTFPELLEEVQKHSVDVRSYDYLPLAEIQACSSLKNKLIDHILVFENFPIKQNLQRAVSGSSSFQVLDMDMFEQTNYDFDILVSPGQEDPEVQITYNSDVYDSDFVYTVLAHMKNTIRQAANPNIKIRDICIITEEEKQQIMYDFNDTQEKLPAAKTIHDMFQQQVEKTPHNISITARDKKQTHHRHQITYLQLNRQANHLAAELQKKGVTYGTIAAIKVQRSIEMIVGLLAILKTNAAYLPIDTTTPPGRKRYIMADSNATFLLTEHNENENNTRPHLTPYEVIDIDEAMAKSHLKGKNCKLQTAQATNYKQNTKRKEEKLQTNAANMQQPETGFNPDEPNVHPSVGTPHPSTGTQLAYVIYTSGTTGKPKGVMVEHRSVINVLSWFGRHYLRFERTHVLQMTEYTFDPSIEEIFGTLLHGAVLHSVWNPLDVNLDTLRDYIRKHVIDILNFVPGLLKELLKDFKKPAGAGIIICGGERLEETVQEMIIKNGYELYNHYGPTEATIDVLTSRCLEGNMVTLGKPVDNTRVYILSSGLSVHMQPIGIPGELCVSGTGVARGYLNNPELTARRFIKEEKTRITGIEKENIGKSFAELFSNTHIVTPTPGGETGHRPEAAKYLTLYKTGDRARWLPDGRIEYFGRIDQQVKIRGHRVELAEIEHRMAAHPQIIEAVVLPYEQRKGEFYLCAYYIVDSPAETETTFSPPLREHLAAGLPGYMIPTHYVKMEKIPLTSTGKIDRNALPKPKAGAGVRYVEPRNNIDKKIIHIWSGILAIEPEEIGIDADFFELGGHSINATVLVAHIEQEFKIRYPLTAIFKNPFIRAISDTITAELERKAAAAKPFEKNLVLLREGDKEHEHIFFIHTGSGGVSGYSAFCDRLPGKFNCWGIKADPLENLSPQQLSVEQLASRYLLKIKTIQPGGPYRIVGWCVGGTVAFEMARQLEWHCEEVKTLAIINSMAPHKELLPHGKLLTRQYQLEAIGRYMPGGKMRRELLAALADREVSEIWPEVIRQLTDTPEEEIFIGKLLEELPKGLGSPLPKYEKKNILNIIYAINVFIGLGTSRNRYLPSGKVAAQLQSYRSEKSPKSQTQHWDDYTKAPVNRYVIKGETLKILDPPNVENIAAKFATSLKEKRR